MLEADLSVRACHNGALSFDKKYARLYLNLETQILEIIDPPPSMYFCILRRHPLRRDHCSGCPRKAKNDTAAATPKIPRNAAMATSTGTKGLVCSTLVTLVILAHV